MISIKNLSKTYGRILALSNITFDVKDGEFIFITGPSGAGKTTLLKLIIGEIKPDTGQIILDGKDVSKLGSGELPYLRQQIGVVFQDFKILPEKTVRENIEIALAVIGLAEDKWQERVVNVLRLTSLEDRVNLFPSQLSGGELQRVSLARALVVDPKVIIADEPTGNLDSRTSKDILDMFERLNRDGITIVLVTHDQMIASHAKRIVRIADGVIVDDPSTEAGGGER